VGAADTNQILWIDTNPFPGSLPHPNSLPKKLLWIIGHLISHNVVGCPGQFVTQCLDGNDAIGLCHLFLVEGLGRGREPDGKVRCLYICPGEITVAVFSVVFVLFLAIGEPLTFHTPTVGGVVSYPKKGVRSALDSSKKGESTSTHLTKG
jgi:hypothetical protein